MEPAYWSITKLVDMFVDNQITIPEIQRKYVWRPEKVRALIDSIYKDYPSGSILLWETTDLPAMHEAALSSKGHSKLSPRFLLLDGQQRLTSLGAVLTGRAIQMRSGNKVNERKVDVYFNLDHPEIPKEVMDELDADIDDDEEEDYYIDSLEDQSFFQIRNKKIENKKNWISVTKLFTDGVGQIIQDKEINPNDPNYSKYLERLNRLYSKKQTYFYPIQILQKDKKYSEVTEVFVRVNSAGVKLRSSDLALAQVTSRWSGAMRLFSDFVEECRAVDYNIDEGFLMKCLVSISTWQNRFDIINKVPIEQFKHDWDKTKKAITFTINFLKKNAYIETSDVIPALFILIPIAVLAIRYNFKLNSEQERIMIRWFYSALMWGRYSRGSTETALDEDLSIIKNSRTPVEDMLRKILIMSGRLEVKNTDLEGKNVQSSFFRMTYVIARKKNAKDWGTGLAFSLENIGTDWRKEYDHIFPVSKLEPYLSKKYTDKQQIRRLINDMGNIAFLSRRHNSIKKDKLPSEYFKTIINERGEEALSAQDIPIDEQLWKLEYYEDFLRERRKRIVTSINSLMESLAGEQQALFEKSIEEKIQEPESQTFELKASMLWDYKESTINRNLIHPILKTLIAFMNTEGGTLLVGVHDKTRQVLGLKNDFSAFGNKEGWDVWQQTLVNGVNSQIGKELIEYLAIKRHSIKDKIICEIKIKSAPRPVFFDPDGKAEFFIRVGNTTQMLNSKQASDYIKSHWD